jgi:riboflavin kinase / FMN adenylyltransferase
MHVTYTFTPKKEYCGYHTVATLGTFDGVHIGHRRLLTRLVDVSRTTGVESAILTFDAHPQTIINPEQAPRMLSTLDEKLNVFESLGIDRVFILHFTTDIARMEAREFIEKYLIDCLGISHYIVGYDHHFGNDRLRSSQRLREFAGEHGFTIEIIPPVVIDGIAVKSSTIRDILAYGNVGQAMDMLGEPYSFEGTVIRGRGVGKDIGFPTANIQPADSRKQIPGDGVYACYVILDGIRYDAVTAIGSNPTFNLSQTVIETHILDLDETIYEKTVRIGFISRLRNIEKFKSTGDLARQISADIEQTRQLILQHK